MSLCALAALLLLSPSPIEPEESYYVVVFSAQRPVINQPNHAHNWGAFIRVGGPSGPEGKPNVHWHTISWMPATFIIRPARPCAEEGANVELQRTIAWAKSDGLCVSLLGPYRIDKCLYDRSVERFHQLESGAMRYKAADFGRDKDRVTNCTHALTTIAPTAGPTVLQPGWGNSSGHYVVRTYRHNILDSAATDCWLLDVLGVADIPPTPRH